MLTAKQQIIILYIEINRKITPKYSNTPDLNAKNVQGLSSFLFAAAQGWMISLVVMDGYLYGEIGRKMYGGV